MTVLQTNATEPKDFDLVTDVPLRSATDGVRMEFVNNDLMSTNPLQKRL